MNRLVALCFLIACPLVATSAESLEILVYGATGKLGTPIVLEALERGHRVTAVSRNPAGVTLSHERLAVEKGDLLDLESIRKLVRNKDVVVVSVRGVIGEPDRADNALQFIAAENVVDALYRLGDEGPRLLHIGGSGSLFVNPDKRFADTLPRWLLSRKLSTEIDGQILALEFYRKVDDVRWTYITPPKRFTKGPRTGTYRIGGDMALEDSRGRTRVSRADFAVAVVDEAETAAHIKERISIAY